MIYYKIKCKYTVTEEADEENPMIFAMIYLQLYGIGIKELKKN